MSRETESVAAAAQQWVCANRQIAFRGKGKGTNQNGGQGGIDHLDLTPKN